MAGRGPAGCLVLLLALAVFWVWWSLRWGGPRWSDVPAEATSDDHLLRVRYEFLDGDPADALSTPHRFCIRGMTIERPPDELLWKPSGHTYGTWLVAP